MARRRSRAGRGHNTASQRWVYIAGGAAALVAVAAVILLGVLSRGDDEPGEAVIVPSPRSTDIPRDGLVLGNSAAPVSLTEYADFQ